MKRFVWAVVLASLPTLIAAQAPASDRITLDLYLDLETVSDPQISPDGSQIIYTRGWVDKLADRRESSLWVMNADGSRNRFLVRGSGARWSPTGDRITYTAQAEPRGTQIFVRYMDAEGAITQVTRVEKSPSGIAWSPDGTKIGFTMSVDAKNAWPIKMPRAPEGARWVETPRIVERLDYRSDGTGFDDDGYRHIFVVPATGGTPRQLTDGNWNHNGLEWTPDGKQILFSSMRVADAEYQWRESDIYSVSLDTGSIKQLTTRKGPDGNPQVSPDGKRVAYTGNDWSKDTWQDSKLYVMNIDGTDHRMISGAWDRSPQSITWKEDGNGVYFTAQDQGSQNLYLIPLAGVRADEVQTVTRGTQMLTTSSIAKGKAVGVLTSPQKPGDIVSFDVNNPSQVKQLTNVNEDILAGKKLGDVTEMWYTSADGMKIQGWYITPPDFDPTKKYPMQLHIHGGPHSMYGVGLQLRLAGARGQRLRRPLHQPARQHRVRQRRSATRSCAPIPSKDYDDLMAGVDELLKKGFVDSRNMFVTGCSGGGVLTAWTVGKTDRFAAASANCPVIDWLSFVGTTDGATLVLQLREAAVGRPERALRRSPLTYVGNVKTPTMLMTGVNDLRTPMPQTEQFYSALKLLKVPTAMVRFNEEWHGTTSPARRTSCARSCICATGSTSTSGPQSPTTTTAQQ